jgi:rRNA maturation protein Nop10
VRCRSCDYDLRALAARLCPECGRAFDPADPTTFSDGDHVGWRRFVRRTALGFCAISLLAVLLPHVSACVATITLGHWPRIYIDDGAGGPLCAVLNWVSIILLMSIVVTPLALLAAMIGAVAVVPRGERRAAIYWLLAAFLVNVGAIVLMRLDPLGVMEWIMD